MPLNKQALSVVDRPLPKEQIKQRPGKGGMTFSYISADLVIRLLNEAFEHRWSTSIVSNAMHDSTAVVGLELTVWDADGNSIHKQQFGSCEVGRGMGPGEAFKGAASDALKKAATLLGLGLELYEDSDETTAPPARLPQASPRTAPPKPSSPPNASSTPPAPAATPKAPPAPRTPVPPKPGNPFANSSSTTTASVPAPPKPAAPAGPSAPSVPAPPRNNPFASASASASGPNPTQMNAMTNLAQRKNLSQSDMIALANIIDEHDSPVQTFEELTHAQAIQVIKAAQL